LRQTSLEQLAQVHDMADGLAQRMKQASTESNSYATFEDRLKTKIFTNGRLKRVMAKMLLGITKQDLQNDCLTAPTYIRVLGFNETGRQILSQASPALPIITNGKHFRPDTPLAKRQWEIDCLAADLYALLSNTGERKGGVNFRRPPVYIK
jgi:predicted nucleotidyltransferase